MNHPTQIGLPLVLASGSPFRKMLLEKLGIPFDTASPDIDESSKPGETPAQLATRLSQEKAEALCQQYPRHLIIGSDQVAMLGDTQLHKPGNSMRAIEQLLTLRGNTVMFHTGLCLYNSHSGSRQVAVDTTRVTFRELSEAEIRRYVELEKPYNSAGAFKSEALGISLVSGIEGKDPNALVGLPLILLVDMLASNGISLLASPAEA